MLYEAAIGLVGLALLFLLIRTLETPICKITARVRARPLAAKDGFGVES